MTYATLMVNVGLGQSNGRLLEVVGDLADRFHARVVGIAIGQLIPVIYGDGFVAGDITEIYRDEMETKIHAAEVEFRELLGNRVSDIEWHSRVTLTTPSAYLAREARRTDIVLTGATAAVSEFDISPYVNLSDLVMQIGRPVLIVPSAGEKPEFNRVVIGWKDTRETRRATLDALPLLKKATHVAVVEIAAAEELAAARSRVEDVAIWLKGHGVTAKPIAALTTGDDSACLEAMVQENGADVIVAGAYGHSRLREWALGGVTRDLLLGAKRCSLLSH